MINCRNFACCIIIILIIIFLTLIIMHIQYSNNNYLEISLYALAFAFITYVLKTECKKEDTQVSP